MAINKKLIHFQNKSTFNAQLKAGNLKDTSIVFIKDTQEIWTHGQLYSKNELQEALQNLSNNLDTISNNVTTNTRNLELQDKRIDYNTTAITAHIQNKQNPHSVTKEQVGLSNVTNDAQVKRSEMGANNGVATLNTNGKIPESQLPAGVTSSLILGEEEGTAYEGSKGSRNKFLLDRLINHGLSTIDSGSITNTNTGIKIPNDNLIYNISSTDIDVVDSPINIPVADKTKTTGSGLLLNTDKKKLDGLFDIAGGLQDIDVANPTANGITLGLDYYTFNKTTGETGTNTRNISIPALTDSNTTLSNCGLLTGIDRLRYETAATYTDNLPTNIVGSGHATAAENGIILSLDATNKENGDVSSKDILIPLATLEHCGLISSSDRTTLNSLRESRVFTEEYERAINSIFGTPYVKAITTTKDADFVSINYGVYNPRENTTTAYTRSIPAATETTAGVITSADRVTINNLNTEYIKNLQNSTSNATTFKCNFNTYNPVTNTSSSTYFIIDSATTSHAGLMSAQDKAKLNSLSVTKNGIPTGGSKNQILAWQSDGVAKWEDLSNVFGNLEDVLAYGVQWDDNQIDSHLTRIGNMSLHKSLPIQNQLKGCIAQGNVVQYWLDNNDWRFKSSVSNPANVTLGLGSTLSLFKIPSINQVDINTGRYFYCIENTTKCIGKITNVSGEDVTVEWDNAPTTVPKKIVMGSMLDGFDGTVKIYCPEFYILSQHKNSKHRVLISTVKLSDQWEYQPAILVDAYKCTVLNAKTDYGYLATLPINSAISVVNTNAYCRGGENRASLDQYLTGDHKSIWNTDLGKPRTNINRTTMRTYAQNAGCDLINYNQYKNIFYWLYVIEYANFNCQEEMQSLTAEGYRQGGLGQGLSNFLTECVEQGHTSMCAPCGVGDTLGNRTDQILAADTKGTYYIPRWRGFENTFGELYTVIDGLNISNAGEGLELYACTDPKEYNDNLIEAPYTSIGKVESQNTYVTKFNLGTHAHIIPKEFISTTSAEIGPLYCHFNTKHVGEPAAGGRIGLNTKCGLASIDFLTSDKYVFAGYRTVSTDVQLPN